MHLSKSDGVFDVKTVEAVLTNENKFITNLFSTLCLPVRNEDHDGEDEENAAQGEKRAKVKTTTRAKSLLELQERLEAITSKKKLTYKEKMTKKGLKNRMKKKSKQDERNAAKKLLRAQNANEVVKTEPESNGVVVKTAKPIYNSEGKMVFSKFDFSNLGTKKDKKSEKDPKKLLEILAKQKERMDDLLERGETEKVVEIKEKIAWRNALAKTEGQKVKDDPTLLKKTVKKDEQKKRSSTKKWQARQEGVAKAKEERQKKRSENIAKRKDSKKKGKLKKAVKRGKVIPGF